MDLDDPRRFRRQPSIQKSSLNQPRVAGALEASFGPGQAGCFGEGGNYQKVSGPLSVAPELGELQDRNRALGFAALRGNDIELHVEDPENSHHDDTSQDNEMPITHRRREDYITRTDAEREAGVILPPHLATRDLVEVDFRSLTFVFTCSCNARPFSHICNKSRTFASLTSFRSHRQKSCIVGYSLRCELFYVSFCGIYVYPTWKYA